MHQINSFRSKRHKYVCIRCDGSGHTLALRWWTILVYSMWCETGIWNRDGLMNVQSPHSGGALVNLRCSARVHHCLRSLERVVDWRVSRLVRLICCRIILTASSSGRLLIYRSIVVHLLVLPPLRLGRVRWGVSCSTWTLMVALTHCLCFLFFLRELLMLWPPVLV